MTNLANPLYYNVIYVLVKTFLQIRQIHHGDCLFESILASIAHPYWYTPYDLRLDVVTFLVKKRNVTIVPLKPFLKEQNISYYTLCKMTLCPGEWGGMEVLLFCRFEWHLATTLIIPGHDQRVIHLDSVAESTLLLGYNGQTHYFQLGNPHYCTCTVTK